MGLPLRVGTTFTGNAKYTQVATGGCALEPRLCLYLSSTKDSALIVDKPVTWTREPMSGGWSLQKINGASKGMYLAVAATDGER